MITRNYKELSVSNVTNEELLFELISRNTLRPAPVKKSFGTDHHEIVIGIGNDNVAWMQIDVDSFETLKTRIKENNQID